MPMDLSEALSKRGGAADFREPFTVEMQRLDLDRDADSSVGMSAESSVGMGKRNSLASRKSQAFISRIMSMPDATRSAALKATEKIVVQWIEEVTGQQRERLTTASWLKDGLVLCALVNAIVPGLIKASEPTTDSQMMDNIWKFLQVASNFGVAEVIEFSVLDLYAEENMQQVILCLHTFGMCIPEAAPEYMGPRMQGVPDADSALTQACSWLRTVCANLSASIFPPVREKGAPTDSDTPKTRRVAPTNTKSLPVARFAAKACGPEGCGEMSMTPAASTISIAASVATAESRFQAMKLSRNISQQTRMGESPTASASVSTRLAVSSPFASRSLARDGIESGTPCSMSTPTGFGMNLAAAHTRSDVTFQLPPALDIFPGPLKAETVQASAVASAKAMREHPPAAGDQSPAGARVEMKMSMTDSERMANDFSVADLQAEADFRSLSAADWHKIYERFAPSGPPKAPRAEAPRAKASPSDRLHEADEEGSTEASSSGEQTWQGA